jgi:hypothetical protein
MIYHIIPDFSPAGHFLVGCLEAELFPKNLGHAHKANEYMATMAAITSDCL